MSTEEKKPRVRVAGLARDGDRLLFVRHQKSEVPYFLLPGGGVDFGEDLHLALRREIREELSCSCLVGRLLQLGETIDPAGSRHILQVVFQIRLEPEEIYLGRDPAVRGWEWLTKEEIGQRVIYPAGQDFLIRYLEKPAPEFEARNGEDTYRLFPWEKQA